MTQDLLDIQIKVKGRYTNCYIILQCFSVCAYLSVKVFYRRVVFLHKMARNKLSAVKAFKIMFHVFFRLQFRPLVKGLKYYVSGCWRNNKRGKKRRKLSRKRRKTPLNVSFRVIILIDNDYIYCLSKKS